ncbi:MAG: HEAT repeat domain-containing protein [Chlorobi bacterium]|nr:HEAT repeat domain-containing protein [Chlorobiota bacterium]MCI0716463.1 HEAT repeat domain-containing protein [Chlorobiota bacterium]
MGKNSKAFFSFVLILLLHPCLFSQMFGQEPEERQRTYDVQHISIDINVDLKSKTVGGYTETTVTTLIDTFKSFDVDAVGMDIRGVSFVQGESSKTIPLKFDYDKEKITIYLDNFYNKGTTFTYKVEYTTVDPEKGLYFIQPTANFPNKPYQVWSQGEGEDNRYWFPCYDYPNDMATVELIVTVDSSYQTLSNGVLEARRVNPDGTVTWQWVSDKPFVSYLVMLAIGKWDVIEDAWDGIPISSYVPPGKKEWGERSFRYTKDNIQFFSDKIGFRYPWPKYLQVAVEDYIYGGMENTGAVVYFDGSVYDDKTEPDYSATNLVAHEIAHQWFGDVVTCKNWNEIWLNESFATYFQMLYTEYKFGKDEFDYNVFRNGNDAIKADSTKSRKPIYIRHGLTENTYDKGSVVLNMMRNLIGEENFWKMINLYITKNKHQNVTTVDLLGALNQTLYDPLKDMMPPDYRWFFEEWIFSAGQPTYDVSYKYDGGMKELTISVQQVQRLDSSSVFLTPVPVHIITQSGKKFDVFIASQEKNPKVEKKVQIDSKPATVIFNSGNKVLCNLRFSKSKDDWLYQVKFSNDAIDRITALLGLREFIDDDAVVSAVIDVMKSDKFWGVRLEAAKVLSYSKNKKVQDIYLKSLTEEKDSRVRKSYITGIGNLYANNPEMKEGDAVIQSFVVKLIDNEKSYYAAAEGIITLARIVPKAQIYDLVLPYLNRDSHVDIIRRNVIYALDSADDQRAIDILIEYVEKGSNWRLRNAAINGLGSFLDNHKVIEFLNRKVLDKNRHTQNAILALLSRARDISSRDFLQQLLNSSNDRAFKEKVDEVLQKLD